jgi:hypothetical protein
VTYNYVLQHCPGYEENSSSFSFAALILPAPRNLVSLLRFKLILSKFHCHFFSDVAIFSLSSHFGGYQYSITVSVTRNFCLILVLPELPVISG